jgi:hypothetical protein
MSFYVEPPPDGFLSTLTLFFTNGKFLEQQTTTAVGLFVA